MREKRLRMRLAELKCGRGGRERERERLGGREERGRREGERERSIRFVGEGEGIRLKMTHRRRVRKAL